MWWNLIMWGVSFILTALLAPKPKLEDAKKENLDPNTFPRATEDAPVPLCLGRVMMRGPNTSWYGDFEAVPITEKVKTSLFTSKKVVVGYKYYLSMDLALCLGPGVALRGIYIDDKLMYEVEDRFDNVQQNNVSPLFAVGSGFSGLTTEYLVTDYADPAAIDAGLVTFYGELLGESFTADGTPSSGYINLYYVGSTGTQVIQLKNDGKYFTGDGAAIIGIPVSPGTRVARLTAYLRASSPVLSGSNVTSKVAYFATPGPSDFCAWIEDEDLFGGDKRGGGVSGQFCFYTGSFTQEVDTCLLAEFGEENTPAYRGISHIVFHNFYIGETPNLRPMRFDLEIAPGSFGNPLEQWMGSDGDDITIADAIYHILVNGWRGLKVPPGKINYASFLACHNLFTTEGYGCGVIVSSPQDGKDVIGELLRQADAVLYEEPTTNQMVLKAIRNDYDINTIPTYGESDILGISNFTKTTWDDVYSQVKISFSNRKSEEMRTAVAQDMAIANMTGKLRTSSMSFPFCYDPDQANKIAARELARMSVPMFRFSVKMKRSSYNRRPGDVVKINLPKYNLTDVVVRIQEHDLGELDDNAITIEVIQDMFAVNTPVMLSPEPSSWASDRPVPMKITTQEVIETTDFLDRKMNGGSRTTAGNVNLIPLAVKPQSSSSSFKMIVGDAYNDITLDDLGEMEYGCSFVMNGLFGDDYGFENGYMTNPNDFYINVGLTGAPPTPDEDAARAGELLIYMNGEWMSYGTSTKNAGTNYTLNNIRRGLMGTSPKEHPAGTRGYIFTPNYMPEGAMGLDIQEGETAFYKMLDIAAGATLAKSKAETQQYVTLGLRDLPLRPRDLRINTSRTPSNLNTTTHTLTWRTNSRDEPELLYETEASTVAVDSPEQYDLRVYLDGVLDTSRNEDNIGGGVFSHTVDLSGAVAETVELRLYSRRVSDGAVSADYGWIRSTLNVVVDLLELSGDANDGVGDNFLILSGAQYPANTKIIIKE